MIKPFAYTYILLFIYEISDYTVQIKCSLDRLVIDSSKLCKNTFILKMAREHGQIKAELIIVLCTVH